MADRQYNLKFDGSKAASVDAYLEYKRIVGDDDGGQMFTPEEYEAYKKKVVPQRMKNRLYTSWTNSSGMDCKLVGPETPCFCQHRYKQHKTDFETLPDERPIPLPCKVRGCKCVSYHYIPLMGGQPIRCTCKHLATDHDVTAPFQCRKGICQKCAGFKSSYSCGCGETWATHDTLVEGREEREARGHPIGYDTPYQGMGGLTGFSSLAEGYMRLDPSGRGAPNQEFLAQQITSSDHAFLRGNVPSIQSYRRAIKDYDRLEDDLPERMSAMRRPGEDELEYYERRYQERERQSKVSKPKALRSPYDDTGAGSSGAGSGAVAKPGGSRPQRK